MGYCNSRQIHCQLGIPSVAEHTHPVAHLLFACDDAARTSGPNWSGPPNAAAAAGPRGRSADPAQQPAHAAPTPKHEEARFARPVCCSALYGACSRIHS